MEVKWLRPLFFLHIAATLLLDNRHQGFMETQLYVPKLHNSMEARMIFVAGLEGTGHHIMQMVFSACIRNVDSNANHVEKTNMTDLTSVDVACEVSDVTRYMFNNRQVGIFYPSDEKNLGVNLQEIHKRMNIMAEAHQSPHLYILGLELQKGSGMMSYPNFNLPNKALYHPDCFVLTSMAEAAGLDFRIIVLQRDTEQIIRSNTRRKFGTIDEPEILILIDNAAVLFTELSLIDKQFYYCVEFSSLVKESWMTISKSHKSRLMQFLHPSIITSNMLQGMLQAINVSKITSNTSSQSTLLSPVQFASSGHYETHSLEVRLRLIGQKCQSKTFLEDNEQNAQEVEKREFILEKIVFNRTRLIFVAGLMGSGLSAIHDMMDICFNFAEEKSCSPDAALSELLFNKSTGVNSKVDSGFFVARDSKSRSALIQQIRERLHKIALKPGDNMLVLGLGFNNAGMMSYPNFDAEESLNHPDVYSLATMAEAMNVDFRVVVLTREPRDILAHLQKKKLNRSYRKILTDNAAALFTQLYMLDRKFFTCIDYGSLGSLSGSQQDALASFLQPAVLGKDLLRRMLARVRMRRFPRYSPNATAITGILASAKMPEYLVQKELADEFHVTQLTARMQLIQALCAQP